MTSSELHFPAKNFSYASDVFSAISNGLAHWERTAQEKRASAM